MNTNTQVKQKSLKFALACAFALGATTIGGSAAAANNDSANASGTVVAPIAIAKATDLAFGSFIAGTAVGTVSVNTDGARTVGGDVVAAGGVPTAAVFNITGAANATYTIAYDAGVTLTGPGTAMALTQVSDLTGAGASAPGTGTLAPAAASLYIGGTLAVGANQLAGAYSGSLTATVNYN
jgi:hypothetical protein